MAKDKFYGLLNDERIAISEGRSEDVREENLELAELWLAELKEAQGQKPKQIITEELDDNGED